jgi:putative photosynthetic complex assembly protein
MPRGVLMLIGALVLAALLGTATVRLSGVEIPNPTPSRCPAAALRFEDGADGSVIVIDAVGGQTVATITGEQGFLRGTLRALARERKRVGAGSPTRLNWCCAVTGAHADATRPRSERIDLESFGPTNAGVFARLLNREAPRQP